MITSIDCLLCLHNSCSAIRTTIGCASSVQFMDCPYLRKRWLVSDYRLKTCQLQNESLQ